MAVTTKYMICEEVLVLLKGGTPSVASSVRIPVVMKLVEQLINAQLKIEWFSAVSPTGETIPDGLVLASYENIPVQKYKQKFSRAALPAIPISLPRGMGVFFVGPHISDLYLAGNSISATSITDTASIISWAAIPNATSYYLERATNENFTLNLTPLYTGTSRTFSDFNLITHTNYWYRVVGKAPGYNNSIFVSVGITTA